MMPTPNTSKARYMKYQRVMNLVFFFYIMQVNSQHRLDNVEI